MTWFDQLPELVRWAIYLIAGGIILVVVLQAGLLLALVVASVVDVIKVRRRTRQVNREFDRRPSRYPRDHG
jgi:CHASE3 domain sensor protein